MFVDGGSGDITEASLTVNYGPKGGRDKSATERARIRIGQRQLLVLGLEHLGFKLLQPFHLLLQPFDLLNEAGLARVSNLGLLKISRIHRFHITIDTPIDLLLTPLHLRDREIPISVVHRFELAAIDRHQRI